MNAVLKNVGTTSNNSNASYTTSPIPNVSFHTVRQVKKGNFVNTKILNLKLGELDPIIKGLHKLLEHSYKASSRAQERLTIATYFC